MSESDALEMKLEPCPFCGGKAGIVQIGNDATPKRGFEVRCQTWSCATKKRAMVIRQPLEKAREYAIAAWNTRLSSPPPAVGGEVEQLGEALFRLSDRLRKSGFLDDDANHAAYERVVAAFQAIAAIHPPEPWKYRCVNCKQVFDHEPEQCDLCNGRTFAEIDNGHPPERFDAEITGELREEIWTAVHSATVTGSAQEVTEATVRICEAIHATIKAGIEEGLERAARVADKLVRDTIPDSVARTESRTARNIAQAIRSLSHRGVEK